MKVSYFHHFLIISFIFFHSCNRSKRSYNDFEITIVKKRIDSINFEAKVIVSDKSQIKNNDKVYILIDKEAKLDSTIRNIKENFLTNKEGLK